MSEIFPSQNLSDYLTDTAAIIDTCVLIETLKSSELQNLFMSLKENGCIFLTSSAVFSEFLLGARTYTERKDFDALLKALRVVKVQGMDILTENIESGKFQFLMHHAVPKASFADIELLLLATGQNLLKTKQTRLLTCNHKDVPVKFYRRDQVITISDKQEVRSIGIYAPKYEVIAKQIAAIS